MSQISSFTLHFKNLNFEWERGRAGKGLLLGTKCLNAALEPAWPSQFPHTIFNIIKQLVAYFCVNPNLFVLFFYYTYSIINNIYVYIYLYGALLLRS